MPEWPRAYHPVAAPVVTVLGWQLTPDTWADLAAWCGGVRTVVDGGQAVTVGGATAVLGDFVIAADGGGWLVERADGFHQRYRGGD